MDADLAFLFGLLDARYPAYAAWEDFVGAHGKALQLWQRMGFLAEEPGRHPCPSCPHCREGGPLFLNGLFFCDTCRVMVDARHLCLWQFDLDALLIWLAGSLQLTGDMRRIDDTLWRLGSLRDGEQLREAFFIRGGVLSDRGRRRLLAFRSILLLRPLPEGEPVAGIRSLPLPELISVEGNSLRVRDPLAMLPGRRAVRFVEQTSELWADDTLLGEVTVGSKEHALLAALSQRQDAFVPYEDLKHEVMRRTGSTDATDDATFCQRLKSRIKKTVPRIDEVIATTNKGDGYRLRRILTTTVNQ